MDDYPKPKYEDNTKLCYMDTESFIVHVKSWDDYEDLAEDIEQRFDASNYELESSLSIGKKQKNDRVDEESIRWRIMKDFVAMRSKMYSYLMDDGHFDSGKRSQKRV